MDARKHKEEESAPGTSQHEATMVKHEPKIAIEQPSPSCAYETSQRYPQPGEENRPRRDGEGNTPQAPKIILTEHANSKSLNILKEREPYEDPQLPQIKNSHLKLPDILNAHQSSRNNDQRTREGRFGLNAKTMKHHRNPPESKNSPRYQPKEPRLPLYITTEGRLQG